ncbi:MAG: nitroreductase/quinone reductase family protein, partial [Chloroflexota bacterium]|nr:nitroreductase/quinone reductase family protein [Chloroflexota bacterium]
MGASDMNQAIIEEFRANDGVVGGYFAGLTLLLLHHKGARSGTERINPLAYQALPNGFAVFASKAGADDNPAWFYNVLANPETTVEVGTEMLGIVAREAKGEEYERIWNKQKANIPQF